MNMKKRVLTFLMAMAMIVSLTACGGNKGPAGTYKLTTMKSDGLEMNVEELAALFEMDIQVTLQLKDDNSFTLDMGILSEGENTSGTWKMDGDSLILSVDGEELPVTYDGKTIVMDMDGESLTFQKK